MEELNKNIKWFEDFKKGPEYQGFSKEPVAYFCAEFGLESDMPTYIGGRGGLAGDYIKEAGDRNFPIVGVGLFYAESHELNCNSPEATDGINCSIPKGNDLSIALDGKQNRVLISLPIHDRIVRAQAWKWTKENAVLYLLDTNIL